MRRVGGASAAPVASTPSPRRIEDLAERMRALQPGAPADKASTLAPLASEPAAEHIVEQAASSAPGTAASCPTSGSRNSANRRLIAVTTDGL
jgi:acyl-CoA reductase-like NAD-dependent aldehyde dehydrogenase